MTYKKQARLTKEERYDAIIENAKSITSSTAQTHEQATNNLASLAGTFPEVFPVSDDFIKLYEEGLICNLSEGFLPYAPRYILPNYELVLKNGSKFLRLEPAKNLEDALLNLLILYRHVPSVTHYPVYLGSADKMLEPYIDTVSEEEASHMIERWLYTISRMIPDSYCHMNIGPEETKAGNMILDAEIIHQEAIPSITMLYDEEITPAEFAKKGLECAQYSAKPSFANHKAYTESTGFDYGIASCYNALPVGGGAFALNRVMISRLAEIAETEEEFFDHWLPYATNTLQEFMDSKVKYMVEESHFFKSNFLVDEGFLELDKFTAMVGIVGMNECVNELLRKRGSNNHYARSQEADELTDKILSHLTELLENHEAKYMAVTDHHYFLHSQVGIAEDIGVTPGIRIAIGDEPETVYDKLNHQAKFEHYFPSGVGDIYPFDSTGQQNLDGLLDIVNGSFQQGMQYFSTYASDSDVVRVTGYLVKKSDLEKLDRNENVGQANSTWGYYASRNQHALERKTESFSNATSGN